MRPVTKQGLFDAAVRGLRAQGWEQSSVSTHGLSVDACLFRGPGTLKCAVGHCVSDAELEHARDEAGARDIESLSPDDLFEHLWEGDKHCQVFAWEMQKAHDENPDAMKLAFLALGEEHGLTWPEEAGRG